MRISYSQIRCVVVSSSACTYDVFPELRTGDILGEPVCEVGEERDVEKVKEQLESACAYISDVARMISLVTDQPVSPRPGA